jgi:hypothetical protein
MLYIDPGSGLFIIQGAISVLLGGIFLVRQRVRIWFNAVFRRHRSEEGAEPEASDDREDGSR